MTNEEKKKLEAILSDLCLSIVGDQYDPFKVMDFSIEKEYPDKFKEIVEFVDRIKDDK